MVSIAARNFLLVASLWAAQSIKQVPQPEPPVIPGMPVPQGTMAPLPAELPVPPSNTPMPLVSGAGMGTPPPVPPVPTQPPPAALPTALPSLAPGLDFSMPTPPPQLQAIPPLPLPMMVPGGGGPPMIFAPTPLPGMFAAPTVLPGQALPGMPQLPPGMFAAPTVLPGSPSPGPGMVAPLTPMGAGVMDPALAAQQQQMQQQMAATGVLPQQMPVAGMPPLPGQLPVQALSPSGAPFPGQPGQPSFPGALPSVENALVPAPAPMMTDSGTPLPPEAMTMQSWASLKGSMDKIGGEVEQIQMVSSDIQSLQSDLRVQTNLWHQAETAMQHENDALKGQIVATEAAVTAGAHVTDDVSKMKDLIIEEERRQQKLQMEKKNQADQDQVQKTFFEKRKEDLSVHLKELNASAYAEVHQAQSQQLQLHTDAVALKLRGRDLEGRIFDTHKQMVLEQRQSDVKLADLKRQLADMQQGLAQLKTQLSAGAAILVQETSQEIPALRQQLNVETTELLRLQQVHSEIAAECNTKTQEREQVLCVEQGQAATRHTESVQFCNPIRMQNRVLKDWLSECLGSPQPGEPGGPAEFAYRGIQNAPGAAVAPPIASNTPMGMIPTMSLLQQSRYRQ